MLLTVGDEVAGGFWESAVIVLNRIGKRVHRPEGFARPHLAEVAGAGPVLLGGSRTDKSVALGPAVTGRIANLELSELENSRCWKKRLHKLPDIVAVEGISRPKNQAKIVLGADLVVPADRSTDGNFSCFLGVLRGVIWVAGSAG